MFAGDGSAPEATAYTVSDLLVPSAGAWYGGVFATIGTTSSTTTSGLASWVAATGRRPHIIGTYETGAWDGIFSATELGWFDPSSGDTTHAIPHVRWKPNSGGATWQDVAGGARDSDIDTLFGNLKDYPRKLFFTVHHEPEDDVSGATFSKANYVAMWQRIHTRAAAAGATNIVWVINYMGFANWAVDADGVGFEDLYPGDDYVDWIAWDPYVLSNTTLTDTFAEFVNRSDGGPSGYTGFYNWATTNHPTKPLMLAEFGYGIDIGAGGLTEAEQATWISNFFPDKEDFPAIRAYEQWHSVGTRDYQQTPYTASVTALNAGLALPWFDQDPDLAP
jgi:hypothetical protein